MYKIKSKPLKWVIKSILLLFILTLMFGMMSILHACLIFTPFSIISLVLINKERSIEAAKIKKRWKYNQEISNFLNNQKYSDFIHVDKFNYPGLRKSLKPNKVVNILLKYNSRNYHMFDKLYISAIDKFYNKEISK